jgi:hypothetical protein
MGATRNTIVKVIKLAGGSEAPAADQVAKHKKRQRPIKLPSTSDLLVALAPRPRAGGSLIKLRARFDDGISVYYCAVYPQWAYGI